MTKKPKADKLIDAIEASVLKALRNGEGKELNDAIANGIKLAALKHRIAGNEDDGDYFGGDAS